MKLLSWQSYEDVWAAIDINFDLCSCVLYVFGTVRMSGYGGPLR